MSDYRSEPPAPCPPSDRPPERHNLVGLQTGLVVAMTQYSLRPGLELARRIAAQLDAILAHPQLELFPDEQRVYVQMRRTWRLRAMPAPAPSNLVNFTAPVPLTA